jgi:hypothetical protein
MALLSSKNQHRPLIARAKKAEETGIALKGVWYGAELLGKLIGGKKASEEIVVAEERPEWSWQQLVESIKEDYDAKYFISGKGSMSAYREDCEFADPFVSFRGKGRFKENVGNLGGLMIDPKLDVFEFVENEDKREIRTRWRFSCVLGLPWKPLLAAAGGTTHVFDAQLYCVKHIESWDVDPGKVVAQLFRPAKLSKLSIGEGE